MYRHTAPLVAALLALADVHSRSDGDAVGGQCRHQVKTAPGSFRRAVEEGENSVAGVLGPPAAVPRQHRVDQPVVVVEVSTPVFVALRGEQFRRPDDIGEEHGAQHPLGGPRIRLLTNELQHRLRQEVDQVDRVVLSRG